MLPSRQKEKSIPKSGLITLLLILILLITSLLFIRSTYFTIGSVVVEGIKYLSVEDVFSIANIPEPINIFSLNTAEIKKRLMCDLRIAEVDISRKYPSTIVINIKERKPLAYIASGYGFLQVDKEGVVLAAFKNIKQLNLPMITGIKLDDYYVGDKVENPDLRKVLNYLALLDEDNLTKLAELNYASPDHIFVNTINSVHIRLGNSDGLADKAKLTNNILKDVYDKKMAVEYIDLTYASPFIKFKK